MARSINRQEALRIVRDFLARYSSSHRIEALRIDELYKIDHRRLHRWRNGETPKQQRTWDKFVRLAADIAADELTVLRRLTDVSADTTDRQPPSGFDALIDSSLLLARSDDSKASIHTAKLAFEMAARGEPAKALGCLPRLMYLLNRHGTPNDMQAIVRGTVRPVVQNLSEMKIRHDPTALHAAIGHLACSLAEGGALREATPLFELPGVRSVWNARRELLWCRSPIIRGETRCWTWNGCNTQHADDLLHAAAFHDGTVESLQSISAVRSEIGLVIGDFKSAWSAIASEYTAAKNHLQHHFDLPNRRFTGPPFARHFHSCTHLFYGVLARSQVRADGYSREDFEQDLCYLEALFHLGDSQEPTRRWRMHAKLAPLKGLRFEAERRLRKIIETGQCEPLSPQQTVHMTTLARDLVHLASL